MKRLITAAVLAIGTIIGTVSANGPEDLLSHTMVIAGDLGLTPESVVLADLQSHAQSFLDSIASAHGVRQEIAAARDAVATASIAVRQARESLRNHPGNADALLALEQAMAARHQQIEQLQTLRTNARQVLLADLPESRIELLRRANKNREHAVPAAFKVHDLEEGQWRAIERAIRDTGNGYDADPQGMALLEQIQTHPATIAAATRLEMYLPQVETVFDGHSIDN